jgi:hypothetical protein
MLWDVKRASCAQFFLLFLTVGTCHADTTVKTRTVITDTGARSDVQNLMMHRDVYYRQGMMRRKDSLGEQTSPSISDVANCESRTGLLIDLGAHEYRTYKVMQFWSDAQVHEYLNKGLVKAVQIDSHTTGTGERKIFFGHTAKHLVTTIRRAPDKSNDGGEETIDAGISITRPPTITAPLISRTPTQCICLEQRLLNIPKSRSFTTLVRLRQD